MLKVDRAWVGGKDGRRYVGVDLSWNDILPTNLEPPSLIERGIWFLEDEVTDEGHHGIGVLDIHVDDTLGEEVDDVVAYRKRENTVRNHLKTNHLLAERSGYDRRLHRLGMCGGRAAGRECDCSRHVLRARGAMGESGCEGDGEGSNCIIV